MGVKFGVKDRSNTPIFFAPFGAVRLLCRAKIPKIDPGVI